MPRVLRVMLANWGLTSLPPTREPDLAEIQRRNGPSWMGLGLFSIARYLHLVTSFTFFPTVPTSSSPLFSMRDG